MAANKARRDDHEFDRSAPTGKLKGMLPDLPTLTGSSGGWMLLALKALAAMGFMTAANLLILYAC
jgi:hypothetical protein